MIKTHTNKPAETSAVTPSSDPIPLASPQQDDMGVDRRGEVRSAIVSTSPTPPEPLTATHPMRDYVIPVHPLTDEDLRARVERSPGFRHLLDIFRGGQVTIRPWLGGGRWKEIPYELVVGPGGGKEHRVADAGVPDITTILDAPCRTIAGNIDLPEDQSPEALAWVATLPLRPFEVNLAEYGDRVRTIVESLLASDIARLQADAEPLWADARAEYDRLIASVRASEGYRRPGRWPRG